MDCVLIERWIENSYPDFVIVQEPGKIDLHPSDHLIHEEIYDGLPIVTMKSFIFLRVMLHYT